MPQTAVNRIPTILPSHRQDIFPFLYSYKVSKSAVVGQSVDTKNMLNAYQQSPPKQGNEYSQQSTSAESNKPVNPAAASTNQPLLTPEDIKYLRLYGRELFDDMLNDEYKAQFQSLLTNQVKITRELRAAVVDWLFEVGTKIKIEDKQVLFQAVNLMDRFYGSFQ